MKAIILEKAGGVENLILKEIDKPAAKENEVLVEVKAISINPVDFKVRINEEALNYIYGSERPAILGWDIAGTVVSVGENTSKIKVGDKVFGMVNFVGMGKAYAEYVATPENHLAKMPENVSFEEAAATTLAALTALQAIQNYVKQGDKVIVHAGSGGVGHFAVQIAKHLGAYVIATSSEKNREFVMSLGADEHIDYRTQDFEEVADNIDYALDGIGGDTLSKSVRVVKDGGTVVSILGMNITDEEKEAAEKRNLNLQAIMVQSNGNDMDTLKELLKSGAIKAHVSKTFSFEEMAKAHTELETGRTVGKVVVKL